MSAGAAIETLADPGRLVDELEIWDTGTPEESTGEVVASVRSLRRSEASRFEAAIDQIEKATRKFRLALERGDRSALAASLRSCEAGLENLGVVPEVLRPVIRAVERTGAATKISGAGATQGPAAGALLVYDPVRPSDRRFAKALRSAGYRRIEASLGGPGLAISSGVSMSEDSRSKIAR
jgi:mevalonate kinase